METHDKFLKSKSDRLAQRLNLIVNEKLKIACRICGITPDDTKTGKKHINFFIEEDKISYTYAEKKICLLNVRFYDETIEIRRIRWIIYLGYRILEVLKLR